MYAELIRKKKCSDCKKEKEISQFYIRRISPDGYGVYCKTCDNKKSAEYRKKNDKEIKVRRKIFRDNNKELLRFRKLKSKRGITKEQYEELLKSQNYRCAICSKKAEDHYRPLALDHDHTTGKIRGILCDNCNRCLGLLKDNKIILQKALEYLDKYQN